MSQEITISADPSRYVTLPIQYKRIWSMYQTTLAKFWTVHDVYLSGDRDSMNSNFTTEERRYILKLLAFMYTIHHTTINKELFMKLMEQVDIKEASYYFGSQADAKKTHSTMYSLLLDELVLHNQEERNRLISDIVSMSPVRDFIRWSIENIASESKTFCHRLLAFATLQGIIFSGTFVLFGWLNQQRPSMVPGLINSNDLIWRDEKLNLEFSCLLFEYIDNDLTEEDAHKTLKEAVNHSKILFTKAFPVSNLGMDCTLMGQYLEHCADKILCDLRFSKLYNAECPFEWVQESEPRAKYNSTVESAIPSSYETVDFDISGEF